MEEPALDSALGNAYLIDKARHVLGVPPHTVEFNIDRLSIDVECRMISNERLMAGITVARPHCARQ
jgi:hypothetical protein